MPNEYVLCKKCKVKFTVPSNGLCSHCGSSNNYKEVNKMSDESPAEKKVPVSKQIRALLAEGKSVEEIAELLKVKKAYVKYITAKSTN